MSAPGFEVGDRPVPSAVLAAQVAMLIDEIREHRRECVPRGEWALARAAVIERIVSLEHEQARQGNRRWQLVALGIGSAFTVFAGLATTLILIAFNAT